MGKLMINDEKTEILLVSTLPYLAKVSLSKIKVLLSSYQQYVKLETW